MALKRQTLGYSMRAETRRQGITTCVPGLGGKCGRRNLSATLWWKALVLGLQIHISEEASSQIRNLQIMSLCMWMKIGDNGEENKIGLLSVLSCFKIFINIIKVFFSSSSSSYNKYVSRKTIQACVWSPTPSFPPTWFPRPGQWAQRWWE